MNINNNFLQLRDNYLFTEVLSRVNNYQTLHPDQSVIKLGIGDVTRPLPSVVITAMHKAVEDLAHEDSFRGYGLENGYEFLRRAVVEHDYLPLGIEIGVDEVFISDGAGSDLGNTSELFSSNNKVAVLDPVYPAYVDTNVMAGRAGEYVNGCWNNLVYLPCSAENGFLPELPSERVDIIYLCFPNNPTGTTLTRNQLQKWVDYALANDSIIIFDSAYEIFIEDQDVPHSIYELEGAKQVAIEIRSYSKTAGFTGVRCGYTIVPKQTGLHRMWYRRQCTKFNGASYISQRGAEAIYTEEGRKEILKNIAYYKRNANIIKQSLEKMGFNIYGGKNAPYLWLRTPFNMDSWEFFDKMLHECQVSCTPGVGFGRSGQGYVRLSSFGKYEETVEAMHRIKKLKL